MKKILTLILLVALLAAGSIPAAAQTLKVGATPRPHAEILNLVKSDLSEVGINLEVIEFTDYVQPNLALAEGDLDANYFQHIPYLENFSKDHRLDLTYTAKVHIEPMGAYSDKLQKAEDINQGAHIAIPNDTVNGGRALLLLEAQGLIELDPAAGITATVLDIVSNPLKLRFSELEAAQLPRVLPDVDLAIINTNFALEAGLDPLTDALFIEGSESPYVNVLAVRSSDVDREDLAKLSEALLSDKVKDFILAEYGGSVVPAF
jgi:D-methionine transport system substrate-binding protein